MNLSIPEKPDATRTREFIYLGSLTSYDLIDDPDIQRRISIASRSMGALKNLWDNDNIDMKTKYLFFLAIPINLLLWGCESWALKESAFDKLDVFIHRSVRRILKIKWSKVMDNTSQIRKQVRPSSTYRMPAA